MTIFEVELLRWAEVRQLQQDVFLGAAKRWDLCLAKKSLESTGQKENARAILLCFADSHRGSAVLRYDPWSFGRIADVPRPMSTWDLKHPKATGYKQSTETELKARFVVPDPWFMHVYLWLQPRRGRQGKSKIQAFVCVFSMWFRSKQGDQTASTARTCSDWQDDLHDVIGEGSTSHLRATNPSLLFACRRVKVPACKFPRRSQLGENLVWSHAKICALGSKQSWPKSPACWDNERR